MKNIIEKFDTSEHMKENIYNITQVNEKVIGWFKYVNNRNTMQEFIGLK